MKFKFTYDDDVSCFTYIEVSETDYIKNGILLIANDEDGGSVECMISPDVARELAKFLILMAYKREENEREEQEEEEEEVKKLRDELKTLKEELKALKEKQ